MANHMKKGAHILQYMDKVLKTPAHVSAVQEALMRDLIVGNVTPEEAKRIQKEIKPVTERFRAAVRTAGLQVTLNSLSAKVKQMETDSIGAEEKVAKQIIPKFTGVPSFFHARCWEASQGGTNTYADAAWHLAIHIGDSDLMPYDADVDEWEVYVEQL